jgi:hypothetical protein
MTAEFDTGSVAYAPVTVLCGQENGDGDILVEFEGREVTYPAAELRDPDTSALLQRMLTPATAAPWTVPVAMDVLTRVCVAMARTRTVPHHVSFLPSGATQVVLTVRDLTWADRFLAALYPDEADRPVFEHTDGAVRTGGVRVLRFDAGDPGAPSGVCLVAFVEVGDQS